MSLPRSGRHKMRVWLQLLFAAAQLLAGTAACSRRPQGASGDRSPVDENFQILIEGNPPTYIPGQQYNISLACANGLKFISFTLVVESDAAAATTDRYDMLGHFEIIDAAETKFSQACENMLESTNTNTKARIDVAWVAPTNPAGGCVLIKAAVLQHRSVWFIDDGFLTKRLCPEEIDEINSQTPPMSPCCACDEAKYEIAVERKWTRNTHARDFPAEGWRTRLSEIIGASHAYEYRFWEYGSRASRGLQELAEHGATQTLEDEIKTNIKDGSIRTIIKAPGIGYRNNVAGTTLANVRVDALHHVISLVAKIEPSPDWVLGVAGLELCLANCTWIDRKVLNLYPWDVGTDAGPSYMSADQPQIPPDVVRRITSTFPSDYRSPFYDDTGAPMKPLATLHITRKKLYERGCDTEENVPLECATHPWTSWSECSSKCGRGSQYKTRAFKNDRLAESFVCRMELRESRECVGTQCGSPEDDLEGSQPAAAECALSQWSSWSACSKRCGKGIATRMRTFLNAYARDTCENRLAIELEQRRECFGEDCGGKIPSGVYGSDDDPEQQFGNLNEPFGTFGDNSYGSSRFGSNRRTSVARNRQPTNYEQQPFERVDDRYDNSNDDTFAEVAKPTGNRQRRPPLEPARTPAGFAERESVPQENIFGSEQLIGQRGRPYGEESDLSSSNLSRGNSLYGSTFANQNPYSNQHNPPESTSPRVPFNRFNRNQLRNEQSPSSERYGVNTPAPYDHRYRASDGVRETNNDAYRRRTVVAEGVEPNNYAVVQEYCFEKPVASCEPCLKSKVIVRNYWFYDADVGQCKIYTSDNCDENRNKFRTLETCEGTCARPQLNRDDEVRQEQTDFSADADSGFLQPLSQVRQRWNARSGQFSVGRGA